MNNSSYPIGTPGEKWNNNNKIQWLEAQKIKRSYQQDVVTLIDELKSTLEVQQYGELNYAAGSSLQSEGAEYDLLQFHFHSPSEHTLNGKSFPLEVHFVHKAQDGTLAVVGVMFEEGAENAELAKIWKDMPKAANDVTTSDVTVNAGNLLPVDQTVIRYAGSLTTPPCSEGVKWHVMTSPIEVSKEQVEKFLSTVPANNRPLQPLNDRSFKTHKHSH
ncbi:MAG: carbonate dehydratase [Pseudoalteromonas sp.]|nr:MAG: carbonate dehydratase [Pseudoalteromonas sp.]